MNIFTPFIEEYVKNNTQNHNLTTKHLQKQRTGVTKVNNVKNRLK